MSKAKGCCRETPTKGHRGALQSRILRYVNLLDVTFVIQPTKAKSSAEEPGIEVASDGRRYRKGKGNVKRLYCLTTNKLKSKCTHCNVGVYTGPDGHKYCSTTRTRRVLCSCQSCLSSKRGGKALCKHNKQKHKCPECGGKSLCHHFIQKSRCVSCFKEGRKPTGLCEHGREKWRGCPEC